MKKLKKLKKAKTPAFKILLSLYVTLVLIFTMSMTASSEGWFTHKIYVDGVDNTAGVTNAIMPLANGLMSFSSSMLKNSSVNELFLTTEQQTALLTFVSEGLFEEAEALLTEFASENYYNKNFGTNNEFGYKTYQIEYNFTYDGTLGESAYVRFIPVGSDANSIAVNDREYFCVQNLAYDTGSGIKSLQRIAFQGEKEYYYYPYIINSGETIKLTYTLFLLDYGIVTLDNAANYFNEYELIMTNNNASIINWNVIFEDGAAIPFDNSVLRANEYYNYNIIFTPPVSDEPIIEPTSEHEIETETTTEIEPITESTTEPITEITTESEVEPTTPTTSDEQTNTSNTEHSITTEATSIEELNTETTTIKESESANPTEAVTEPIYDKIN